MAMVIKCYTVILKYAALSHPGETHASEAVPFGFPSPVRLPVMPKRRHSQFGKDHGLESHFCLSFLEASS